MSRVAMVLSVAWLFRPRFTDPLDGLMYGTLGGLGMAIEESLLYVQPLYLQAEGGRIPELKRVVVAYQNRVVMQETLDGALTELFGGSSRPRNQPEPTVAAGAAAADTGFRALAAEARQRYEAALQAQRDLDWARYGEEMRQLGQLLERLGPAGSGQQR